MIKSGFFNSKNHDKQYFAADISRLFNAFITDGVFENVGKCLIARANNAMEVVIQSGMAFFNSTWTYNDSDYIVEIDEAPYVSGFKRIDGIFIRSFPESSITNRDNEIYYLKGTEVSQDPQKPVPVAVEGEIFSPICYVTVNYGTEAITGSMIENCVGVTDTTPFITGILETASAELLVEQWTSELSEWSDTQKIAFIRWAESIRDILDEETAGHLQLEIDELKAGTGLCYDSYEDAVDDMINIPEGGFVYTPEPDPSIDDIIQSMTSLHLAGSQVGAGTKNFTFNTEAQKRMLCITKKSGVIVESKEIPVDVLDTDDVILLGNTSPVIGGSGNPNLVGKALYLYSNSLADNPVTVYSTTGSHIGDHRGITLTTDSSNTTGATLTYNGNNSFTISVTDSSLSVYVYVDMLVLGGSASGRNVSFNAAGTSLQSTDVEGAVKEIDSDLTKSHNNIFGEFVDIMDSTSSDMFTCPCDGYLEGSMSYLNPNTPLGIFIKDAQAGSSTIILRVISTSSSSMTNALFVRKGMKAYIGERPEGNAAAWFIPLE